MGITPQRLSHSRLLNPGTHCAVTGRNYDAQSNYAGGLTARSEPSFHSESGTSASGEQNGINATAEC